MNIRCTLYSAVAFGFLAVHPSIAADGSAARISVEIAEKAIAKGYGAMCSLSMMPVETNGYYPCIDIGPYRYVREYQKISAFVLVKDAPPFKIMGGSIDNPRFTIGGPWETDLAQRAVQYWNDVVEGGAITREKAQQENKARDNAASFIQNQIEKETQATQKQAEPSPVASKETDEKADTQQGSAKNNDLKSLMTQTK